MARLAILTYKYDSNHNSQNANQKNKDAVT